MHAGLLCKFNSCDVTSAKPLETNDAYAASNHPMANSRVLSNASGLSGLLRANSFNLPDKFTERGHIRTTRGRADRNECARIHSECHRRLHPQNRNSFLHLLSPLSPQIVLQMMPPQPFGSFDDLVSDNTAALQADTLALTDYTAAASVNLSKTAVATGPWQASYCSQNSRIHTNSIDAIPRTAYHQSPPAASSLSTPTCESGFQGYCGGQLGYS